MGGGGATYDYGFRIYNPQIARFLSEDPLGYKFPYYTPYQYAGNSPVFGVDLDGLETLPHSYYNANMYSGVSKLITDYANKVKNRAESLNRVQTLITQQEPSYIEKAGHYFESIVYNFGEYTDAEDVSVLKDGKTVKGEPATKVDYAFASVGVFIPFVSGGSVKQVLKGFYRVMGGSNADAFLAKRGMKSFDEFYERARKLDVNERVAEYKQAGERVAEANSWKKNSKLSERHKRDVYTDKDGNIYSLDTQHGEFEILNERGKHQGAIDFEGVKTKDADTSGGHDLNVK